MQLATREVCFGNRSVVKRQEKGTDRKFYCASKERRCGGFSRLSVLLYLCGAVSDRAWNESRWTSHFVGTMQSQRAEASANRARRNASIMRVVCYLYRTVFGYGSLLNIWIEASERAWVQVTAAHNDLFRATRDFASKTRLFVSSGVRSHAVDRHSGRCAAADHSSNRPRHAVKPPITQLRSTDM